MAKSSTVFSCKNCGSSQPQLLDQCPRCKLWDGFNEVAAENIPSATVAANSKIERGINFDVKPTGDDVFDLVMDGGLVPGTRIVLAGGEGGGKSTAAMQLAGALAKKKQRVLYVAGEEEIPRILARARRLGTAHANILITKVIEAGAIVELAIKAKVSTVIIDSINTAMDGTAKGEPGSTSQMKAVVQHIATLQGAKITTLFLSHLNAKGDVGGPRWMRHMVDVVLALSLTNGDGRMIVATKNRDGRTHQPADLEMTATGLKLRDVVRKKLPKFEETQGKLKLMKGQKNG